MTSLQRVVLAWAGPPITGSAVTVLHYSGSEGGAPPVAALKSAFSAAAAVFPSNVTITFPGSGDVINDADGGLTGVWSSAGGGTVTGSSAGGAAAGVGACIGWTTGGIVMGSKGPRKLRGRTFLVPLGRSSYADDGTLGTDTMPILVTLANAIQASGPLAVWHRPTTPAGTDGNSYGVISARVRDKVAFLSSRRD